MKLLRRTTRPNGTMSLIAALVAAAGLLAGTLPGRSGQGGAADAQELKAKHLYSETANQRTDIAAGLKQAKAQHKRVILDFGGDWCGDCQVLDVYFHDPANLPLLEKNFVIVHVWIGRMDKNLDLAAEYGVPIGKGVPALAVLDANGTVLHAQSTGEFNDMRHMSSSSVTEFLNRWKA